LKSPPTLIGWLALLLAMKAVFPLSSQAQTPGRERLVLSAEGSGVGNGTGGSVDAIAQQFLARLNNGIPLVARDLAEATGWCSRITAVIEEALMYEESFERDGRLDQAEAILRRTLEIARNSLAVNAVSGPITHRLIQRGYNVLISLDAAQSPAIGRVSKINFLKNYLRFAAQVSRELDQNWYLPHRYAAAAAGPARLAEFRRTQSELEQAHARRRTELQRSYPSEVSRRRAEFADQQDAAREEHEVDLADRRRRHASELRALRNRHEEALEQAADATTRRRLIEDYSRDRARAVEDFNRGVAQAQEDYRRSRDEAGTDFDRQMQDDTLSGRLADLDATFQRDQEAREQAFRRQEEARSEAAQREFANRFVQFAQQQLRLVLSSGFSEITTQFGERLVVPVGSDRAVLRLAEWMTVGVADDLAGTLAAYHIADPSRSVPAGACSHLVEEMRSFHRMLASFNMGQISPFRSSRQAMQNVRSAFQSWVDSLGRCR
jgi:hypothetical protein